MKNILQGMVQEPWIPVLLSVFFLLAAGSVVLHCLAMRPRKGTMEWMRRVDRPEFEDLSVCSLQRSDLLWGFFAILGAISLCFCYLFIVLCFRLHADPMGILSTARNFFLKRLLLSGALALVIYLFQRLSFSKPLPSALTAALAGLTLYQYCDTFLLLALALMCLYFWMCADYTAPIFFNAFWLVISGILFSVALLTCWSVAWMSLFFLGVYITTQILRYRGGETGERKNKLAASLTLTLVCLFLGMILLWLAYYLLSGRAEVALFETLHSNTFYSTFLPTLDEKLRALFFLRQSYSVDLQVWDGILFIAGMAAAIPLVLGIFKERDGRCIWLLALLLCSLAAWLFSGLYLMPLALLLALGWQLSVLYERGARWVCIAYTGIIIVFYILFLILV